MVSEVVLIILFSYLLGSIPFGYILGKFIKKIDIRKHGSGNVGATNALRVLGWKIGLVALLLDMAKGFLAVSVAAFFVPGNNFLLIAAGFTAITGHIFTVFLRFRGGKGVATSAGVFAALIPIPFVIALAFFTIVTALTKYVSLGSISAAVILVAVQTFFSFYQKPPELEFLIMAVIVALFIIIKHKTNIKRLLNGTENKISFQTKKPL
jgi:glycerol-3-phosphate acyltransferase PlsY